MANYNNVTSVGITDDNGVKVIAYSYDVINGDTGVRQKLNAKGSRVIVRNKTEILNAVKVLEDFALELANADS